MSEHKHLTPTVAMIHMGRKLFDCDECYRRVVAFAKSGAVSGENVMGPKLLSTEPIQKGRPVTGTQPPEALERRGPGRPRKDVA